MVNVLPEVQGFGSLLGRNLGAGLGQGVSRAADFASQMAMEKAKMGQRQKMIQGLMGTGSSQQPQMSQQDLNKRFLDALPEIENKLGRDLTPQDLDQVWGQMSQPQQQMGMGQEEDPFATAEALAIAGEPEIARVFTERAKTASKQSFAREQAAEPKILELGDKLRSYEQTHMRQERLGELFKPELEDKFPSSLTVGLFTKDGEMRPTASALLSPEAQEAVKLVTDEIKGAKDTFGSRVTNFDATQYLKTLPSLLNTPEGRRRVLRDLSLINQLNRQHAEGVLDIIEEHGGAGKISMSKAEQIYRKRFAPKEKEIRQQFKNPESAQFSDLPSPRGYEGRMIEDEETGQRFRSNGQEWIPE